MILTNKKYTEPLEVLRSLVDDFGQAILIGEQKDIGEFNLNFLERIEEGLGERVAAKKYVLEDTKEDLLSEKAKKDSIRASSILEDQETQLDSTNATSMDLKSEAEKSMLLDANSIQNLFFGKVT